MSAIPLEDAIERESSATDPRSQLPPKALAYFFLVTAVAIAVTAPFLAQLDQTTGHWFEFTILAASVALAQFFVVRTPGNKSYHTTGVFLIAAVLLLPPALLAVLPLIQHVPEWLRSRRAWYIQSFNILVFTIATMAAWGAAHIVSGAEGMIASDDVRFALAGTAFRARWGSLLHECACTLVQRHTCSLAAHLRRSDICGLPVNIDRQPEHPSWQSASRGRLPQP